MTKSVMFVGDNHCDESIKTRKDDYLAASVAELSECLQIARERKLDAVVLLGDVFNRMEVGGACRNAVLAALQADENGEPWPMPVYVVVGNHDVAHDPENLMKSALGTLIQSGVVIKEDFNTELGIAFGHFTPNIEKEIEDGFLMKTPATIWALHASVVTQPIFGKHIFFDNVPLSKKTRLVVAGHVHMPMEAVRMDGVRFINPGNVGRNAATKENMGRLIKVLIVEYSLDGKKIDTELVPLKSSLPADQVFHVEKIQAKKDETADQKQFIQTVGQMSGWIGFSSGDKYQSLRQSGAIKKVDNRVVNLAVETLQEVNDKRKN